MRVPKILALGVTKNHNLTTGKIYTKVINDERQGKYLGKTVQIIPHITDAIQDWIINTSKIPVNDNKIDPEICLIELGGTLGDFESAPYAEALRQLKFNLGAENVLIVNVCYVPVLEITGETKTKPTQAGIRESRRLGIPPDILVVRCSQELTNDNIKKLSNMCQIPQEKIFMNQDLESIYQVPLHFNKKNLFGSINSQLKIIGEKNKLFTHHFWNHWLEMTYKLQNGTPHPIAIVGKYTQFTDSYLTLIHAIKHAASQLNIMPTLIWIDADQLLNNQDETWQLLKSSRAIIIPGGFGIRGTEGMILAANYARTNNIPCLGICLGFQIMVIEFARNILNLDNANSIEFDHNCDHPVLSIINIKQIDLGGTMRLGLQEVTLEKDSLAYQIYNKISIWERHRHRYEVNPKYLGNREFRNCFSGFDQTGQRMEIFELKDHLFYLGCQFHAEYLTRPNKPHPIFLNWLSKIE